MTRPEHTEDGVADDLLLRRPSSRSNRFVPRPEGSLPSDSAVLQRNILRPSPTTEGERTTSRQRVIAGDLPAWEPLPPGELFLKRRT